MFVAGHLPEWRLRSVNKKTKAAKLSETRAVFKQTCSTQKRCDQLIASGKGGNYHLLHT